LNALRRPFALPYFSTTSVLRVVWEKMTSTTFLTPLRGDVVRARLRCLL
jgi:hypothetical protein